jgi:hypothetical protein
LGSVDGVGESAPLRRAARGTCWNGLVWGKSVLGGVEHWRATWHVERDVACPRRLDRTRLAQVDAGQVDAHQVAAVVSARSDRLGEPLVDVGEQRIKVP